VRSFDTELAQFLRAVYERTDIRYGIDTYSKVWAIMKVCVLPSVDRLHDHNVKLTRKWPLCRPTSQVQGVCSGHSRRPVVKNIILSHQYSVYDSVN
jgi:hypothetical protein